MVAQGKRAGSAEKPASSRSGVLRLSGQKSLGALDSAAVVLTPSELARIKSSAVIKTAEDLRREAAEAEAENAARVMNAKERKVGGSACNRNVSGVRNGGFRDLPRRSASWRLRSNAKRPSLSHPWSRRSNKRMRKSCSAVWSSASAGHSSARDPLCLTAPLLPVTSCTQLPSCPTKPAMT